VILASIILMQVTPSAVASQCTNSSYPIECALSRTIAENSSKLVTRCVRGADNARSREIKISYEQLDDEKIAQKCNDAVTACKANWHVYYERVRYRGPNKKSYLTENVIETEIREKCYTPTERNE
jgi:hypothetical protein